jgi:hypothetical protein
MASILGLLAAATVLLGAPTVLSLEVEQERVTAADLARVIPQWRQVPGDIAIAYAPLPGLTRELARAELERLAARYGLVADSPAAWPERLRISRRQRQLERREAEAAVAAAVGRHLRVSPEDVGVEFVHFVSPQVPAGELEFRTHIALPRSSEPLAIPLTWVTRERRSGTLCCGPS